MSQMDADRSALDAEALANQSTMDAPAPGALPEPTHAAAPQRVVVAPDQSGADPARVGRYVVIRRLGEGGMGVVYLAYDPDLDRKVALKLVRNGQVAASQGRARVQQEAQAMAQVSHPNIVHVYEVGDSGGHVFIAMEYVPGGSLAAWQQQRAAAPRALEQTLRIYLQAAAGLLAAHEAGFIHRDFKPDNVLLDSSGRARVVDFGLARALGGPEVRSAGAGAPNGKSTSGPRLTQAGAIMGTPGYMSPEQVRGAEADARSDQFSFCAALYEAIYQKLPFAGDSFEEFAREILAGRLRPPPPGETPLAVERALLRGLAIDPAARYPSLQELIAAIEEGLHPDSESPATQRASRWLAGFLVLTSVLAGVIAASRGVHDVEGSKKSLLLVSATFSVGILGTLFALRRTLLRRSSYRRLAFFAMVMVGYLDLSRLVAYALGQSARSYIPLEMFGIAALLVLEAPKLSRRYAWLAVLSCSGGILLIFWPQLRFVIASAIYPILGTGSVYFALTAAPRSAVPAHPDGLRETGQVESAAHHRLSS